MNTMTEDETTITKSKKAESPKLVMTKRGPFIWSGSGWYVKAFVKISTLNDEVPLAPRYFKDLPEQK